MENGVPTAGHAEEPKAVRIRRRHHVRRLVLNRVACPPRPLIASVNRKLKPVGKRLGLNVTGYHTFRRGLATDLHQNGSADKNIQNQLRHSDPATTRNVYMQGVPEQQRTADHPENPVFAEIQRLSVIDPKG